MNKDLNLLDSLIENNSIIVQQEANNWEEAVALSLKPLEDSNAIKNKEYIDAVIEHTKEFGPYYLISKNVAMPHGRPEDGVLKSAFSLITLKKPVQFENDDRKIYVLIGLSSESADIHVSSALPQVVSVFENEETEAKIKNAKSTKEIIKIISSVDLNKYLERS